MNRSSKSDRCYACTYAARSSGGILWQTWKLGSMICSVSGCDIIFRLKFTKLVQQLAKDVGTADPNSNQCLVNNSIVNLHAGKLPTVSKWCKSASESYMFEMWVNYWTIICKFDHYVIQRCEKDKLNSSLRLIKSPSISQSYQYNSLHIFVNDQFQFSSVDNVVVCSFRCRLIAQTASMHVTDVGIMNHS